jgi:hypothetical protein
MSFYELVERSFSLAHLLDAVMAITFVVVILSIVLNDDVEA